MLLDDLREACQIVLDYGPKMIEIRTRLTGEQGRRNRAQKVCGLLALKDFHTLTIADVDSFEMDYGDCADVLLIFTKHPEIVTENARTGPPIK